jgi:hypothetical protein
VLRQDGEQRRADGAPDRCSVFSALVARGISAGSTALNAAAMDGEIVQPIPAPSTNSAAPR